MGMSRYRALGAGAVKSRVGMAMSIVWLILALVGQSACANGAPRTAQRATATAPATLCGAAASASGSASGSHAYEPAPSGSLTYGVNLAMYDTSDEVVNDPSTQAVMRSYGVPIIRMPFRSTLSDAYETQAMQAIRAIGALPLVIVHGPTDKNALADDVHILRLVQRVFGASTVYVEFGNEPELAGISATAYAASWNTVIACLKSLAPTYKYIGPVNAFYDPQYVTTFDQLARPRPDFNSWHEYACATFESNDACMSHLNGWSSHITGMSQAVHAAIGVTIPMMLTEWNLDDQPDPRYHDPVFIQSWTSAALSVLAANRANGLYAAMQYCVTNNPSFNLIDSSGAFTPAGEAFFGALRQARVAQP